MEQNRFSRVYSRNLFFLTFSVEKFWYHKWLMSHEECWLYFSPLEKFRMVTYLQHKTNYYWHYILHLINFTTDKTFLFSPGNRLWHFLQTVSLGDNLHEMSVYFLGKVRKIFQNVVCCNFSSACKVFTVQNVLKSTFVKPWYCAVLCNLLKMLHHRNKIMKKTLCNT